MVYEEIEKLIGEEGNNDNSMKFIADTLSKQLGREVRVIGGKRVIIKPEEMWVDYD